MKLEPPMILRTPRSIDIEITGRCNLLCSYCSHFTSPGEVEKDLPSEDWLRFFKELNRCKVTNVCLSGGEPFYREDLKELISGIVSNRMRFSILTNGTLISKEMAEYIASTRRCDYVQVSIDGSRPKTHDAFRGKGSFMRAIRGVRRLLHYKNPVTVRATIHRENIEDLENIARLLLEDIGLPSFSTNSAAYLGLCRQKTDDLILTPREHSTAIEVLSRLQKRYKGRIIAQAGPLANKKMWKEMIEAKAKGLDGPEGGGHLSSCNSLVGRMAVRADGVMIPCSHLAHIELGSINTDDLQQVWLHHPELERLRARTQIPLNKFQFCQGCGYVNYCRGGCPAVAYAKIGRDDHPNPESCLIKFLEDGGRLPQCI